MTMWRSTSAYRVPSKCLHCRILLAISLGFISGGASQAQTENVVGCPADMVAAISPSPVELPKLPPVAQDARTACEINYADMTAKPHALIDIRDTQAYARLGVQGSMNLPAATLRYRSFLKGESIVLVNDGKSPSALIRACEELREQGFADVHAYLPGIRGLHANGAVTGGDAQTLEQLYRLSPGELQAEAGRAGWRLIGFGVDETSVASQGLGLQSTFPARKLNTATLTELLANKSSDTLILVAADAGAAQIAWAGLTGTEQARVMIASGGLTAYQTYLQQQKGVLAQAGKRPVRPCGEL